MRYQPLTCYDQQRHGEEEEVEHHHLGCLDGGQQHGQLLSSWSLAALCGCCLAKVAALPWQRRSHQLSLESALVVHLLHKYCALHLQSAALLLLLLLLLQLQHGDGRGELVVVLQLLPGGVVVGWFVWLQLAHHHHHTLVHVKLGDLHDHVALGASLCQ